MEQIVSVVGTGLRFAGYGLLPLLLLPLAILAIPKPLGGLSEKLSAGIDRVSGVAMGFALTAGFLIILIQLAAVLLRYVFGLSFSWLNDSVIFTFAMMFMLGAAATLRDDGHVRVDILRPRFSPKVKAGIEMFGSLVFIVPIGILILYAGSGLISRSWIGLEHFNESDGLPIKYLFKTMVPLFAILMIGQALSQAIKAALVIRDLRPADADSDHSAEAL
ncbi:MAG: TRAP transporter small permease subunit [Hyphomonadaceae bacterium]|nr:TRAP transporter small permease subunit [Hyphomonadaceae bacterium]